MALSRSQIYNGALAECPADRINSPDDGSLEAETCNLHYQPALEMLLEDHDWDFATRRIALASLTNDRTDEWGYAYALPSDMARPRYVLPYSAALSGEVYIETGLGSGLTSIISTPTKYWMGRFGSYDGAVDYRISNGKLYSGVTGAVLEYVTNQPSEATFPARFTRALQFELASRIVMPLTKNTKRQGELVKFAEVHRERAKAADMNRDPETTFDFVPEEQAARMGAYGAPGYWRV